MPKIPHLRKMRIFSSLSSFTIAREEEHPIDRKGKLNGANGAVSKMDSGGPVASPSARGEDV